MPDSKTNISLYMDVLMESFKPASTTSAATHFFSTDEIYDSILQLNPGAVVSKEDVYQAMLTAGFVFKQRRGSSGIDFRWILVSR